MEEMFNQIKRNVINYDKRIEQGDIFIPKEILKIKELSVNEKLYISCYYIYDKNIKKVDEYFKAIITKQGLLNIKKKLSLLDYIKIKKKSSNELKIETIKKSHKGSKCDWCGQECYVLQEHHYPISAKNGGKEIVKICPNCHYTFHKLEAEIYE